MIKVFHIISHFEIGGAERVAISISKSRNPDIEYHVVEVLRGRGQFAANFIPELKEAGIIYHRSMMPEIHFHYLFERLAAACFPLWFIFLFLKYRPDVIHSHTEVPDMSVYAFFKLFPWAGKHCRVVRTIHNTRLWTGLKRTGRIIEKFFLAHNSNVCISQSVKDSYQNEYGDAGIMIYNGMAQVPQKTYNKLRKDKINILFAGRFEEQKGISKLVEIIKNLKDDDRYFFHIIGSGTMEKYIHQQLDDLQNVEINGPLYGLASVMQSFDYLLMPSVHEGLALMILEASMAYLPSIINACEGLRDTLPTDWPLKVSDNNIDEYMNIFRCVLPDADRDDLSQKAYNYAQKNFGIDIMQHKYEAIYEEK
jgi:glycosyltransferase involved in cell wall biosynthesis